MAITYLNGSGPKPPPPKKSRTELAKEKKQAKKEAWHADVRVMTQELYEELEGRQIPPTIMDGLDKGRVSAQDLLIMYEDMTGEKPGPRLRRYVVANIFAHHAVHSRAPGANLYNDEVADLILEKMCDGITLRSICRDPYMPHIAHFLRWVQENDDLRERYTLAQQLRAEVWGDELIELADKVRMGVTLNLKSDGTTDIQVSDMLTRTAKMIDVRKFLMTKILPYKYGNETDPSHNENEGPEKFQLQGGLPTVPLGTLQTKEEKEEAIREAAQMHEILRKPAELEDGEVDVASLPPEEHRYDNIDINNGGAPEA